MTFSPVLPPVWKLRTINQTMLISINNAPTPKTIIIPPKNFLLT